MESDRSYMVELLRRIVEPPLLALAAGQLKARFPVELSPVWDGRDRNLAYLECFARVLSGIAPWLALPEDDSAEGNVRRELRQAALRACAHAFDPDSPDYLPWRSHEQALVEAAGVANAFIRAPRALWEPLDATTKARAIAAFKSLRRVSVPYRNWLLFVAMIEAFLLQVGEDWDPVRVDFALKKMGEWYVGDGWVSDGRIFSFDYYNGFVIQPMLVEVLDVLAHCGASFANFSPTGEQALWVPRMQRYAHHLERLVSPAGTFPPIGRSVIYRTAAFQPLALLALRKSLPSRLPEGQVRALLTAVHRAVFDLPGNFTPDGYLTLGFAGHQPDLADWYSNNGSTYIATAGFLALGLPATDSFWTAPAQPWTQQKAFAGQSFPKDFTVTF